MLTNIGKIVKLYKEFPEYIGKVKVETPYGMKKILYADIIEKNAKLWKIKTLSFTLYCSMDHEIFSEGTWKFAKDINVKNTILTKNGKESVLESFLTVRKGDLFDIQVEDVGQYYSNGILSHNSNFLETIPFALFGKTHRDIVKANIINWKNKKGCEVQQTFKKNDDVYNVIRAIKPDTLEIYKNNILVDKPSHVRDYQKTLEDIIGIDFQVFMELVHSNINSSTRILSAKKPDKRKFMDKAFGLWLYEHLTKTCNKKLRTVEKKSISFTTTLDYNKISIDDIEKRIKDLKGKIESSNNYKKELEKYKKENVELKGEVEETKDTFQDINTKTNNTSSKIEYLKVLENKIQKSWDIINQKIKSIDIQLKDKEKIDKESEKLKILNQKKEKIEKVYGNLKSVDNKIDKKQTEIDSYYTIINDWKDKLSNVEKDIIELETLINNPGIEQNKIEGKPNCPTCGTVIDSKKIIEKVKKENHLRQIQINKFSVNVKKFKEYIDNNNESIKKCKEKIESIKKIKNHYTNIMSDISSLAYTLNENTKFKILKVNKDRYVKTVLSIERTKHKTHKQFKSLSMEYSVLEEELEELKKIIRKGEEFEKKVTLLKEKIKVEEDGKNELQKLMDSDYKKIEEIKNDNKKLNIEYSKLNELSDYFNSMKFICKDENIKQFAISSIRPFLNKQTNYYLSNIGHNFYVTLDKWLEATIKGPGISNASYKNLSAGESKSIDLSLQFALLDITKIRSGIWPDILSFDELLDSSLDSISLQELFNIIEVKQKQDNSKLFIISHREEVTELEHNNIYYVEKNQGYSNIRIL